MNNGSLSISGTLWMSLITDIPYAEALKMDSDKPLWSNLTFGTFYGLATKNIQDLESCLIVIKKTDLYKLNSLKFITHIMPSKKRKEKKMYNVILRSYLKTWPERYSVLYKEGILPELLK